MKRTTIILALGLAACGSSIGEAADWNNGAGGIRDHGGMAGVPVPAPVPIMESFSWYLRADLGLGLRRGGSMSERGMSFGLQPGDPASVPFGSSSSWYENDGDAFVTGGVGVGRYFSPRMRGDITVDTRTSAEIVGNGSYSYLQWSGSPLAPTTNTVSGTLNDRVEVRDTTMLANAYFDLRERGPFTPYVGIGAGFAVRTLDRSVTLVEQVRDAAGTLCCTQTVTGTGKDHVLAPAVSATVGAAIGLSQGRVLDFNYKYTYIGEASSGMMFNGTRSVYTVGDSHDHALRAGIRWNIW